MLFIIVFAETIVFNNENQQQLLTSQRYFIFWQNNKCQLCADKLQQLEQFLSDKNETIVSVNCDDNKQFCDDTGVAGFPGVAVMRLNQVVAQIDFKSLHQLTQFYADTLKKFIDESNTFETMSDALAAYTDNDFYILIRGKKYIQQAQFFEATIQVAYVPSPKKSQLFLIYKQLKLEYDPKLFESVVDFVFYFGSPWFRKYNIENISSSPNGNNISMYVFLREVNHLHDIKMLTIFFEALQLNQIRISNESVYADLMQLSTLKFGYVDTQENVNLVDPFHFTRHMRGPTFVNVFHSQNCYLFRQTNPGLNNSQIQFVVNKNGSGVINEDFYIPGIVDELVLFIQQVSNAGSCIPMQKGTDIEGDGYIPLKDGIITLILRFADEIIFDFGNKTWDCGLFYIAGALVVLMVGIVAIGLKLN
ncbi:Thioredoxin-like_superfamily [Hexamita inflata]|uniref:Thioredoxin-like_superfamily n=1 Tax=Hexamita inflata TaxID=28002 RepID=A0ABP1HV29_9EUKA